MEYEELIRKRYSVRAYLSNPVEDEKLQKVIEAGLIAPTAANQQPFQILVVRTASRQEELGQIYTRDWFIQAPLILCVCGIPSRAWRRRDGASYLLADAAIVMDHMILEAANLGLGTCWIAAFDVQASRKILGIPDDVEPLFFTPLGYPADHPVDKERKQQRVLVRFENW